MPVEAGAGVERVELPTVTHVDVIAECAQVTPSEILALNPALITHQTPPGHHPYAIKLPLGTKDGFDCELLSAVSGAVGIPVIASGGAGALGDFGEAVTEGQADAVLAASVFHDGVYSVAQVKSAMADAGAAEATR